MDRTGTKTVERIGRQGQQLHEKFAEIGAEVAERMAGSTEQSAAALLARVAEIDSAIKANGETLIAEVDARNRDFSERLGAVSAERWKRCGPKRCPSSFKSPRRRSPRARRSELTPARSPASSTPAACRPPTRSSSTATPSPIGWRKPATRSREFGENGRNLLESIEGTAARPSSRSAGGAKPSPTSWRKPATRSRASSPRTAETCSKASKRRAREPSRSSA